MAYPMELIETTLEDIDSCRVSFWPTYNISIDNQYVGYSTTVGSLLMYDRNHRMAMSAKILPSAFIKAYRNYRPRHLGIEVATASIVVPIEYLIHVKVGITETKRGEYVISVESEEDLLQLKLAI